LPNVFTTLSIETLVGGGSWFTQSVRSSMFSPLAFGQVEIDHSRAKINWMLPCREEQPDALPDLVENLTFEAGLRGSMFLLASTALDSAEFTMFRNQGFCTYGWERYWLVENEVLTNSVSNGTNWRRAKSGDQHEIIKFQRRHYAPALRAVIPLADEDPPDYILSIDGSLQGTARILFSSSNAILRILLDSCIINPQTCIQDLLASQAAVQTYWYIQEMTGQEWMEEHFQRIAQPATPRQELMVKYFAVREKLPLGILNHSSENSHPDPIAPYVHTSKS